MIDEGKYILITYIQQLIIFKGHRLAKSRYNPNPG